MRQAVKGRCPDEGIAIYPCIRPTPVVCKQEQNIRACLPVYLLGIVNRRIASPQSGYIKNGKNKILI
jgi:hypothetical protein